MDISNETDAPPPSDTRQPERRHVPSNPVYARVGEAVLASARDGVQRKLTPQDIIREIAVKHGVHLNVGELRLLLASRMVPEDKDSR